MGKFSSYFWILVLSFAVFGLSIAKDLEDSKVSELRDEVEVFQILPLDDDIIRDKTDEKRAPINHHIVARLIGRSRENDVKSLFQDKNLLFMDTNMEQSRNSVVGPRYYIPKPKPEPNPEPEALASRQNYHRSARDIFSGLVSENKDAIQEYGRVIRKRGRIQGRGGFLYEPHLFGHDVLFPAPIYSPSGRKGPKSADAGKMNPPPSTPPTGFKSPELFLPGKFRIMK